MEWVIVGAGMLTVLSLAALRVRAHSQVRRRHATVREPQRGAQLLSHVADAQHSVGHALGASRTHPDGLPTGWFTGSERTTTGVDERESSADGEGSHSAATT